MYNAAKLLVLLDIYIPFFAIILHIIIFILSVSKKLRLAGSIGIIAIIINFGVGVSMFFAIQNLNALYTETYPGYDLYSALEYGFYPVLLSIIGLSLMDIHRFVKRGEEITEIKKMKKKKEQMLKKQEEIKRRAKEKSRFEEKELQKIKKIIQVSDRIEIEMMRKSLNMKENVFLDKIYDWAAEFNFRIDGNYVVINQDTVNDFLDALDKQFDTWERREETGEGKI